MQSTQPGAGGATVPSVATEGEPGGASPSRTTLADDGREIAPLLPPESLDSGVFGVVDAGTWDAAVPRLVAAVACERTTPGVARRIARAFLQLLGARTARVYLTSEDGRNLRLAASENVDPVTRARLANVRIDEPLPAARAARSGLFQLLDASDAPTFGRPGGTGVARAGGGVVVALPLFVSGDVIGAVSAGFDELGRRECATLLALSDTLGALFDRARLLETVARLEEGARLRAERAACAVHDLRQPLNVIVLCATRLAKRSDPAGQGALDRVRASGLLLDRMIADLGDPSFLDSGRFSLRVAPTDVGELVTAAVKRHVPHARISVEKDIPPVALDAQRIDQILVNLLVNAVKYGNPESPIFVGVVRKNEEAVVSVTNEGDGVPESERTKIFEPYYRARERKAGAPGMGLGLHICKTLVEGHGGQIWVESIWPSTRFSFSLPLAGRISGIPPPGAADGSPPI